MTTGGDCSNEPRPCAAVDPMEEASLLFWQAAIPKTAHIRIAVCRIYFFICEIDAA
jgi:hypothetical protein